MKDQKLLKLTSYVILNSYNSWSLGTFPLQSPTMATNDDSRDFISAIKDGNAEVVQAMLEQGGIELD